MSRLRLTNIDSVASLGMFTYASSVVVTPIVLLQIADELSFSLAEGGGLEAVRAGFLLAILIASGAAAARFGKMLTLGSGAIVLGLGLVGYSFAPAYWVVMAAIVLVGLGGGVLEALINPLVQDAHPEDSGRYLNIVNAFFSVGVLTSVLVVGDLLSRGVSWRLLVAGVGVLSLLCGFLFLLLRGAHGAQASAVESADSIPDAGMFHHSRRILREREFWLFSVAMFCGGGAEGGFTFWSASYVQIHFNTLARGGAFGTAAFAAGMVVGRFASGRFVGQDRLRSLIVWSAIIGVIASLGAWAVNSQIGFFAIVFAAGLSIACFWPSIQSHAATVIGHDSTALFILLSCAGIPGFGLTSWIMGLVAESYSLRASLLVIPALLALLAVVMIVSPRAKTGEAATSAA
jgi:fucose permease